MYAFSFYKTVWKSIFLSELLKSKNLTISVATEDVEQHELAFIAGGNTKENGTANLEASLAFSYRLNLVWPHDPAAMFLNNHLIDLRTYIDTKSTGRYLQQFCL